MFLLPFFYSYAVVQHNWKFMDILGWNFQGRFIMGMGIWVDRLHFEDPIRGIGGWADPMDIFWTYTVTIFSIFGTIIPM